MSWVSLKQFGIMCNAVNTLLQHRKEAVNGDRVKAAQRVVYVLHNHREEYKHHIDITRVEYDLVCQILDEHDKVEDS